MHRPVMSFLAGAVLAATLTWAVMATVLADDTNDPWEQEVVRGDTRENALAEQIASRLDAIESKLVELGARPAIEPVRRADAEASPDLAELLDSIDARLAALEAARDPSGDVIPESLRILKKITDVDELAALARDDPEAVEHMLFGLNRTQIYRGSALPITWLPTTTAWLSGSTKPPGKRVVSMSPSPAALCRV